MSDYFSRYLSGSGYTSAGNTVTVYPGGTLNDTWYGLYGDTVNLGDPSTLLGGAETLNTYGYTPIGAVNVSYGSNATINVNGYAVIGSINSPAVDRGLTVNVAPGSALNTQFTGASYLASVSITGGSSAWLFNNAASQVFDARVDASVMGSGSWTVESHSDGGGSLEFAQYVSPGQTINTAANGHLQIDQPQAFQGSINMAPLVVGQILLKGIQADNWTYQSDMLSIYDNGYLMDHLHVAPAQSGAAFTVENTTSGVALVASMTQATHGVVLPLPNA